MFTISESETYHSEGQLDVRLVTINPSDANVYSYANAGYKLSCTLDASDSKSGITWTGPDGDIASSKYSNDESNANIHILSLESTSKSGEYKCKFAFATGTDTVPEGVFGNVNYNLVKMTTSTNVYSTYGAGVTVTIACEVTSPSKVDLKFWDGSQELNPTSDKYDDDDGKTIAEYEKTVDAADKGGTFSCRKSETEYSTTSTKLTVFSMSTTLAEKTRGNKDSTTTLMCVAQSSSEITQPTFAWLKDSSAATETPETLVVADDQSSVTSKLPITFTSDNDAKAYKCVVTYTGLAAGTTLESSTTVIMNSK